MKHTNFHKNSPKETQVSTCFLLLHVCDVIHFWDNHARMRINGLLVSFDAFERKNNRVNFQATFINIATRFWKWKFRIRNPYPMDQMCIWAMTAAKIWLLFAVFSYFLFLKRHFVLRASSSDDLTCRSHILTPIFIYILALCLLHKQNQRLQICVVIYHLALPCSMIVAIEQISFIGWNSCMPRPFFF